MRKDGRSATQLRPVRITPNFLNSSLGSVLIETGETRVLCTVNMEEVLPNWMRSMKSQRGWLTAEYSMLPGSTHSRSKRERGHIGGRTQEIQRLIGRSLRAIIDLSKIPDMTFIIDCDVLQADGGTRTAAITGSFVALKLAIDKLLREGKLKQNPIRDNVAAVAIGIRNDQVLVDLDYDEDSQVDLDMNVVLTRSQKILEIQGTAERAAFTKQQVNDIIESAQEALVHMFELQNAAAEGQTVEG